jgi:hypothetical protein
MFMSSKEKNKFLYLGDSIFNLNKVENICKEEDKNFYSIIFCFSNFRCYSNFNSKEYRDEIFEKIANILNSTII